MNEAPQVTRHYHGSDAAMTETVRAIYTIFQEDLAAFTAFNGNFNVGFAAAWLVEIEAAEGVVSDNVVIDQQASLSTTLQAAMVAARNKWGEVKFFVEEAFPGNRDMLNVFGLNDYDKARRSQAKMLEFLTDLKATTNTHAAALITAGYTQPRIDAIDTIMSDLRLKNTAQNTFIRKRPKLTTERITILNEPYDTMTRVNSAAQIIFVNDVAKRAQYTYDPAGEDDAEYDGVVAAQTTVTIASIPYNATREITMRNVGAVPLTFWLLDDPGVNEGTPAVIAAGGEETRTMALLNANTEANELVVENASEEVIGNYEVVVEG